MNDSLTPDTAAHPDPATAQALVALCSGVLPVWGRQLATSRTHSESAVAQMMQAFADIGPHINMAERQSEQINEALAQEHGGIIGLEHACAEALAPVLADASLAPQHREALTEVLRMVAQAVQALQSIARPFQHETQMVASQVERMYIGFQYQDRISQMMTLLENDIARLCAAMQPGAAVPELAGWLEQLASQYAMAEQIASHDPINQGEGNPGAEVEPSEMTFF